MGSRSGVVYEAGRGQAVGHPEAGLGGVKRGKSILMPRVSRVQVGVRRGCTMMLAGGG